MIYWTRAWNPIVGCTKCSPACSNCYAERLHTQRHKALLAGKRMPECYREPFDTVRFLPERLAEPQVGGAPQRYFACNMSDMFHKDVREEWLCKIFQAFAGRPRHTFLVLTKRWKRMQDFLISHKPDYLHAAWPLPNVWLGVTIWDQASADRALPILLNTPAAKRWASYEPALGPVNMGRYFSKCYWCEVCGERQGYREPILYRCLSCGFEADSKSWGEADPPICPECGDSNEDIVCRSCGGGGLKFDFPSESYPVGLDWVATGGETGPGAPPSHPDWFRKVRDDCKAAGVPFFFKQWGEYGPAVLRRTVDGAYDRTNGRDHHDADPTCNGKMMRLGSRRAGRVLDGRTWEEVPNV